jgi:predicted ribonuclease toxin of YeeF-YezG toxin-antitoxin module
MPLTVKVVETTAGSKVLVPGKSIGQVSDEIKDSFTKFLKEESNYLSDLLKRKETNLDADEIIRDGSHMMKGGKLKPNCTYQTGEYEYIYKTDEFGRIKEFNTDELKFTKRESRLPHKSNTPGKEPGDHSGHLAADRFGGSPELDNLVSQLSSVNLSKYKKLENQWAKAIEEGKQVSVNVKINYDGNSTRPSSFDIKYDIDGRVRIIRIDNQGGYR